MRLCGSGTVQRKIVVLGDGACGKTSLLNIFTRGYFPSVYEPTVFENYHHDVYIDNVRIELDLWDTAGQEEFERLRSLAYGGTHIIMLCFAIDSKKSFSNIQAKWVPEIRTHCPQAGVVLAALKCDLRSDDRAEAEKDRDDLIQYHQGLELAKSIKALRYLECSAVTNRGVNEAFTEAARVALQVKDPKDSQCCIVQ